MARDSTAGLLRATDFARRSAARASDLPQLPAYDHSAWDVLYDAMVASLGLSPETFQMVYPTIAWDWPAETAGRISAAAYDALSTIPQASAIGKYLSSGERFNDQYEAFLNVIDPAIADPDLLHRIDHAYDVLVEKTNAYDAVVRQARAAYAAQVPDGDPPFTPWLAAGGRPWQKRLGLLKRDVDSAAAVYRSLVDETETPDLTEALDFFADRRFYAELDDPQLADLPAVPHWTVGMSPETWRRRVESGEAPGGTIVFTNAAVADTAHRSLRAAAPAGFWGVRVDDRWQPIEAFASDASLSASVTFRGFEEIGITPSGWYRGVRRLADGPYKRGYSKDGRDGTTAVFGEDGFLPFLKTGLYAGAGLGFSISVDPPAFAAFEPVFRLASGLRIGPFTFIASPGGGWQTDPEARTFRGSSTSRTPGIFGFAVEALPGAAATRRNQQP